MFALWMFGSVIENYWGGRKYLLYYLMTGIGAAMTHYIVLNHQLQALLPTIDEENLDYFLSLPNIVGASGSIYGLLLAFGMLFPNDRIYLYFLFPIKAKWFVLIFGLLELFSGITGTADGVAHFAHLGGMVFGIVLILLWRRRERMQAYDYEPRQRWRWRKAEEEDYNPRPRSDEDFNAEKAENRRRIDEILDKISRNGYDSLTMEEKEFLFKSSNREKRW